MTVQFFLAMIACAINERQQKALGYRTEDVLVLKDILKAITALVHNSRSRATIVLYSLTGTIGCPP